MKHSLAAEILEHLVTCGGPFMLGAFYVPRGHTLGQSIRRVVRIAESCPHDFSFRRKETISTTLTRLKQRGLLKREGSKKKAIWRITKEGKRHFHDRKGLVLPPKDGKIRLVIFDIPECERKKRDWLRTQLLGYDYSSFQKSVWIGTRPLPKEFSEELEDRDLTSYVHVVGLEDVGKRFGRSSV